VTGKEEGKLSFFSLLLISSLVNVSITAAYKKLKRDLQRGNFHDCPDLFLKVFIKYTNAGKISTKIIHPNF